VKLLRRTFLQLAGAATAAPTFSRVAMAQVYRWEIPTRELNTESRPPPPTSFKREQPGFGDDLRAGLPRREHVWSVCRVRHCWLRRQTAPDRRLKS
jgi:hypothetical protein